MTTEDDFQKLLDANITDHDTRLIFADWLQERNDPRAEGYRALGSLWRHPGNGTQSGKWIWWCAWNKYPEVWAVYAHAIPQRWHEVFYVHKSHAYYEYASFATRREAENAAAAAFALLSASARAKIFASANQYRAAAARNV